MKENRRFPKLIKALLLFAAVFICCTAVSAGEAEAAVVVIDPGHGGTAGSEGIGAIYDPYVEKNLTLELANKLRDELAAAGVTVYMTRTSDAGLSLEQRAAYAKSVGANLMVSIHFNASGPHDKTGAEVWTSAYGDFQSIGHAAASHILPQLTALGLSSKGIKTKTGSRGDYYGIIRNGVSNMVPTIIVEHCFIDNPYDRSILASVGTSAFAHADAVGIINYIYSVGGVIPTPAPVTISAPASAGPSGTATKYGCPIDSAGNVTYTDAGGASVVISGADWNWLLSQWSYTGDAEYYLHTLPASQIQTLLQQHAAGAI